MFPKLKCCPAQLLLAWQSSGQELTGSHLNQHLVEKPYSISSQFIFLHESIALNFSFFSETLDRATNDLFSFQIYHKYSTNICVHEAYAYWMWEKKWQGQSLFVIFLQFCVSCQTTSSPLNLWCQDLAKSFWFLSNTLSIQRLDTLSH